MREHEGNGMTLHRMIPAKRLLALLVSAGMALTLGACSSDTDTSTSGTDASAAASQTGNVAIFTPSDGITISQQTPMSKWAKLVPEIVTSLKRQGVKGGDISVKSASSLEKQSQSVQDYVVDHVNDTDASASKDEKTTLIVAPVAQADESDRQYGDYAGHALDWNDDSADGDEREYARSAQRLVSALQLARNSGMKVVLVSNTLKGYVPDVYAPMSTAEQIGRTQARELVNKLALDKASSDNPKHIEVLLPLDESDDDSTADETFVKSVFAGIWKVLGPYFKDGKAVSPSGTLTASSTDDDWEAVAFDSSKDGQAKKTLATRLGMDSDSTDHTRIDGIIACNDYIAGQVADGLDDLGYTGSSADVNPSITISGIVGNITGKKDLRKQAVPDPSKAPSDDNSDDGGKTGDDGSDDDEQNARWPIVTGYGAYAGIMPNIVNGKQWMTAVENRKKLAGDIATVCVKLNASEKISGLGFIRSATMEGKRIPTIHEKILAVSAGNLKKTLIEPGYISLADAGL